MKFKNPQRIEQDNLQLPKSVGMNGAYSRFAEDVVNGSTFQQNPVSSLIKSIPSGDPEALKKLQVGLQGLDPNTPIDMDQDAEENLYNILVPNLMKGAK